MKSRIGIVLTFIILAILSGCSANAVIRVGTPVHTSGNEGIEFHKEITDSKSIEAVRGIIDNVEEIEKPQDLNKEHETFFSLDRPKEGIAELWLYVYYQDDGSSILYKDGAETYFALSKQETTKLRNIIDLD
ncbi:hypothetical protein QWT69_01895 [Sporosarcina oncorhynchi]|uniref:Uncharacterized protein n=1 Tax=Sporosarcina oncorhynchi TaxID=3056444 RepID=A0ABZ0L8P3_9BACL|nr:hypothetical protein [Sporosarcina sp. T2O-4]WOV87896.1 hypothetical protein QWT69_01895 [Sporosarcina sp. T2O-4]